MNRKGFTLIEVAVVLVVVSALAAVALPKMHALKARAVMSELTLQFKTFERYGNLYAQMNQSTALSLKDLGMDLPSSKYFSYSVYVQSSSSAVAAGAAKGKGKSTGSVNGNGQDKQTLCHQNHSITVADPAVYNAHLAHGDGAGACAATSGLADLIFQAVLQRPLESDCKSGATMQSIHGLQGTSNVELSGSCSRYSAGLF